MPTFFRCCLLLTPLCFSACTIHKVGDETAVTLDTGNEVVDAASYVVAGAKLQQDDFLKVYINQFDDMQI